MKNQKINIIEVPISELGMAEYNPRKHSKEQADQLKESIKRFGMVDPIICNSALERKNIIIGGHFRAEVAKDIGMTTIPVVYVKITDIIREKELNLRLSQNIGEWDYDLLKDFDIELLLDVGFDNSDLSQIWDNEIEIENDIDFSFIDELKNIKETDVKEGEIYKLGKSYLICGDSLNKDIFDKLLGDKKIDMVYWDPPFNINVNYDKGIGGKSNYGGNVNDNKSDKECKSFLKNILENALNHINVDAHIFTYCDQKYIGMLQRLYEELRISNKRVCLWVKNGMGLTPNIAFNKCYEPCLYGIKGKPYLSNIKNLSEILNKEIDPGNRTLEDIIDIFDIWLAKRDVTNEYEHPTQKPLSLHEKPLKRCTKVGDVVLDMCAGSGSTLLACEQLNRICYSIEMSPIFCQLIINRFQKFYGIDAVKIN